MPNAFLVDSLAILTFINSTYEYHHKRPYHLHLAMHILIELQLPELNQLDHWKHKVVLEVYKDKKLLLLIMMVSN